MRMKKAVYTDPTGGGDDMTLTMPAWVEAPHSLIGYTSEGERHIFDIDEEQDEEDEDDLNDHPTFGAG